MSLEFRADRRLIRSGARSTRYLLARVEAPAAPRLSGRPPVNLAFVLDRSGSMHGEKIRLAREAVLAAIRSLRPKDRFSVVVYDDEVDVVVASSAATPAARREAESVVRRIEARGTTDLAGGWLAGASQVAEALDEADTGRCLLLTDGLANVGITDPEELVGHARELAGHGIATTTFGVGEDYDEQLLGEMAHAGGGNYYYIESTRQIPDFIASEVGEALQTVAREVRLEVDVPSRVRISCLNDLEARRVARRLEVEIGTLVSEQLFEVVLKLEFPRGAQQKQQLVTGALGDRETVLSGDTGSCSFTYASHEENDLQERDRAVDRAVAAVYAARARSEALEHNRQDRYAEAQGAMSATASRIAEYADDDGELQAIVEELQSVDERYAAPMPATVRKNQHMMAWSTTHHRNAFGAAMRSRDEPGED